MLSGSDMLTGECVMKIREKRLVETVIDRVCDVCQQSVLIEINNDRFEECAELSADWGYGSGQDGNSSLNTSMQAFLLMAILDSLNASNNLFTVALV